MRGYIEHFRFEWRSAVRHPSQLLLSYLFPIGFFLVMGAVMPDLNPYFLSSMVPAFAVFTLMTGGVLGMPSPLVEMREAGVLKAFRIIGVPNTAALTIPAMSGALHMLLAASVVSALGPLIFLADKPLRWGWYVFGLLLAAYTFAGLGSLIGVVSSNTRSTVLWSQIIFLPSTLLGGLMLPTAVLPEHIRPYSLLLPSTHMMQLLNNLAFERQGLVAPWVSALSLFCCGTLAFGLAVRLYLTEQREAKPLRGVFLLATFVPFVVVFVSVAGLR